MEAARQEIDALISVIRELEKRWNIVSNEVGLALFPDKAGKKISL